MALSYFQIYETQYDTAQVLKPNPEDRNVSPAEMAAFVNEQTDIAAIDRANGDLDDMRRFLSNGIPVIVEVGIDPPGDYAWHGWYGHYWLVVAYDDELEQIWTYDSWFGTSAVPGENATTAGRIVSYEELEMRWRQFNRNYIALYQPEQSQLVADIINEDMDDNTMWRNSLLMAQSEVSQEPENGYLWFNLGTSYNALGEYESAAAAFDQGRAQWLPKRMLYYQFGPYEAYYETGRFEDVILLADFTLANGPYFEEAYYYKGLAYAALGDREQAEENFQNAIDFNPNFLPAQTALDRLRTGSP